MISPGFEASLKNRLTRGCLQLRTSWRAFRFKLFCISNLVLFSSLSLFWFVIMILLILLVLMLFCVDLELLWFYSIEMCWDL